MGYYSGEVPQYSGTSGPNVGFDEVKAMDALEDINRNYKQMMGAVETYQNKGINTLCEHWKSKKGKESITELVNNLNTILEKTTSNLSIVFDVVNEKAEAIDRDSDGIGYEAVAFEAQSDTFSASNAQDDADNGKVAQWNLVETNKGVEYIKSFLVNRVHKNMDEIEVNMYNIEAAFNYSEDGKAVSDAIKKITNKIETFSREIEKSLESWEDKYLEDAKAHGQNVEQLQSGNGITLDLDF